MLAQDAYVVGITADRAATALVKPSRSVHDVDASSVLKKMKKKEFARGVNREDVIVGAQELEIDLERHIQFVIDAMRRSADALGLAGVPQTAAPDAGEPASLTINVSSATSVIESGYRQRLDGRRDRNRTVGRHDGD